MRNHVAVPVMTIVALAGLAECLTYFAVAPAPVSQSAALAAPLATQAPPLVWETDTLMDASNRRGTIATLEATRGPNGPKSAAPQ